MTHPPPPSVRAPHATAITSLTFAGPLEEKLRDIAAAGFSGVELFESDVTRYPGTRQDVRALCDELSLEIVAYPFEGMLTLERVRRRCGKMNELRVAVMVVPTNAVPSLDVLREATEIVAEHGIRMALDAVPWAPEMSNWELALRAVENINHPSLGLVLDSFNVLTSVNGIDGMERIPSQRVFHVHVADAPALKMDARQYSRHHRNFPGQGALDVKSFMGKVKEIGYNGPLSLEIYNDEIRAAPNHRTARDGLRSLRLLMDEVYGGVLPPPPEVIGIEAMELAVVERCVPKLERFMRDIGLRMVARHVNGDVSVFAGGGVNIIINSEPESFASASMVLHDYSVCAMAIRVKNIQQAVERATALGCLVIHPKSRHEAVYKLHAPDGRCFIYLVDQQQMWKRDYQFEPDDHGPAYPYLNIDHVAHAFDRLGMDRFVLFYRAVFGMVAQGVFELADPFGMTKTRALVTPNQALRFPLTVSDDRETNIGQIVRNSSGNVVHHIALGTTDIFAAVTKLRKGASQNRFLRIPQFYYEDIAARYNLLPDFVARMRELDIMYDRDEHGEFMHLSTEQFGDHLFFELIQRSPSYNGFGVVNAAVRINLHHERMNLGLRDGSASGSPNSKPRQGVPDKGIVAVFPTGCEEVVNLIGAILGMTVGFSEDALAAGCGVVGLPSFFAASILPKLDTSKYVSLHLYRIDLDPLGDIPSISSLCTYEYIFALPDISRRDLTRFLTFITGQSRPHEAIMAKPRSTFIPLTYPDIRPALPNLGIITIGADAIEFRIDYLREGITASAYNPLPRIPYIGHQLSLLRARTELPIIFTLRSQPEGGRCPAASHQPHTHEILLKGLQWGCEFIDVELLLPAPIRLSLASRRNHSLIMGSYHDLVGRMKWSTEEPARLYHTSRSFADITKIVGFAVTLQDNHDLEQFRAKVTKTFPHPFLGINAGAPGQLSRILNPFFTPITHPMLPTAVAPGQLSAAEINRARHIVGLEPGKTIFTVGYDPELVFLRKCINELELPHSYSPLPVIPPESLSGLARRIEFGGAMVRPPVSTAFAGWVDVVSDTARDVGEFDTILAKSNDTQTMLMAENLAAKVLVEWILREYAPSAFTGTNGIVIAKDANEARAACWALRAVGVAVVWTAGFSFSRAEMVRAGCRVWRKREGGEGEPRRVSLVVSALREEDRGLLGALVKLVREENAMCEGGERAPCVVEARCEEVVVRGVERGVEAMVGMRVAAEVGWVGARERRNGAG